jgi:ComF family protein
MKLLQHIIAFVAPPSCMSCGAESSLLCQACIDSMRPKRGTCYRCNALSDNGRTCERCRRGSTLAGVTVAAHYEGAIKDIVWRFKYQQAAHSAVVGSKLLAPLLAEQKQFDLVTAVPTSADRRRTRGYDQAELLAKELARELDLPYRASLVRLGKRHQVGHSRQERLAQVANLFAAKRKLRGQRVLLIDDVVTTGATMEACARELKAAGAGQIWGAVIAKH